MNNIISIGLNTWREMLREKVIYLIFALFSLSVFLPFTLADLVLISGYKLILDFQLASFALYGAILSIFLGVSIVFKEIDKKTIYLVITKPVARAEFILGKYLGLFLILLLFSTALGSVTLLAARSVEQTLIYGILQCLLLCIVEFIVLTSLSILFSVITSPLLGLFSAITCYFAGHFFSNFEFLIDRIENPLTQKALGLLIYLFDLNTLNIRNEVVYGKTLELTDFFWRVTYGGLLTGSFLLLTFFFFRKREF